MVTCSLDEISSLMSADLGRMEKSMPAWSWLPPAEFRVSMPPLATLRVAELLVVSAGATLPVTQLMPPSML